MLDYDPKKNELYAYGEVYSANGGAYFEGGFTEVDFLQMFRQLDGGDVRLNIRSDGGDVVAGMSIVNQIRSYEGKVTAVVDSMAASIASVIAAAADELWIYEGSMMMIHNPWTIAMGDAKEFRELADILDQFARQIAGVYAAKSGNSADHFVELMNRGDQYFDADQLDEMNLIDGIISPGKERVDAKAHKPVAVCSGFARRNSARLKMLRVT